VLDGAVLSMHRAPAGGGVKVDGLPTWHVVHGVVAMVANR
jgi:hypothetical protein